MRNFLDLFFPFFIFTYHRNVQYAVISLKSFDTEMFRGDELDYEINLVTNLYPNHEQSDALKYQKEIKKLSLIVFY